MPLTRTPVNPGIRMNTDPELLDIYVTLSQRTHQTPSPVVDRNLTQVRAELGARGYTPSEVAAEVEARTR